MDSLDILRSALYSGRKQSCVVHLYIQSVVLACVFFAVVLLRPPASIVTHSNRICYSFKETFHEVHLHPETLSSAQFTLFRETN